jgi:hypothetical protein
VSGEVDEWDAWHRCQLAQAILGQASTPEALRKARLALDGWNEAEIAAGRRGVCNFCLAVDCTTHCDPPRRAD